MTTKATFRCVKCGHTEEYSICAICHGVIDFPHKPYPTCPRCDGKMEMMAETIRTVPISKR